MATIQVETLQITMANGKVIAMGADFEKVTVERMGEGCSGYGVLVDYENGRGLDVCGYMPELLDGLDGELADGETFKDDYGGTWTRYGDEMVVTRPAPEYEAIAISWGSLTYHPPKLSRAGCSLKRHTECNPSIRPSRFNPCLPAGSR